jgi:hypothetical protein
MRRRLVLSSAMAVLLSSAAAAGFSADASAAIQTTSPVVTINVTASVANPGSVIVETTSGSTLGSCLGSSSPGTATCAIPVTANRGVLFYAQVNPGKAFNFWQGSKQCKAAPGPVCHVQVYTAGVTVTARYGLTGPGPIVTTSAPSVVGDTAMCTTPGSDTVTANGTGFPATTPVTLSDNGTQVASGTTDSSGFAQLTYTATSEPGLYRTLVMAAGAQTATTDVYAISEYCAYPNEASGHISFTVVVTDMDANVAQDTYKFGSHHKVLVPSDASGEGSASSPSYACPSGAVIPFVFTFKRGTGTPEAFHSTDQFTITC